MNSIGQVARFGAVGALGFVVDGGLLSLLALWSGQPYLSRLVSFPVAAMATWWLNRTWTFEGQSTKTPGSELGAYFAIQIGGALTNLMVYYFFLRHIGATPINIVIAFVAGSAAGLCVNFTGSKWLVFK